MYIQYIDRIERVIVVREPGISDALISDDEDIPVTSATGSGSGSQIFEGSLTLCCYFGNCSCPTLYTQHWLILLVTLSLIIITTNVELSLVILLADLANITIIGHNYPTVSCNGSGGLHFVTIYYELFGIDVVQKLSEIMQFFLILFFN